ncbi:MAG: hypothetical protein AAGC66_07715, partial [Leifsonia sp.]
APAAPAADQGLPTAPPPPAYPPAGSGAPAAPVAVGEPPRTVNIAFWLYVVGAVLSVVSGIITIATIGGTRDAALEQIRNSPNANGQNAQALVDGIITAATIWAIVTLIFWAVVFVLFAYFMRRGANWARIVLTVLTALSLLNVLAGYGVGFLQFAATVVALVLIWLRPSSEYFAAVRASKAPRA